MTDHIEPAFLPHGIARLGPPIVVLNTAHSGSRLLAKTLADAGVFMGAALNDSLDAMALIPVVRGFLDQRPEDGGLDERPFHPAVAEHFRRHLDGLAVGRRWGWKLSETLLVLPEIERIFPGATFVHILRDGRDVAFSPFNGPKDLYWRKIYFGTDRISSWHGFPMTRRAYRRFGHLFDASRWRFHVDLVHRFAERLGPRFVEIRYEDLVLRHEETRKMLLERLSIPPDQPIDRTGGDVVRTSSIGKWKMQPRRKVDDVLALTEPTLSACGYAETRVVPPIHHAGFLERLMLGAFI